MFVDSPLLICLAELKRQMMQLQQKISEVREKEYLEKKVPKISGQGFFLLPGQHSRGQSMCLFDLFVFRLEFETS